MTTYDFVSQALVLASLICASAGLWIGMHTRREFTQEFVNSVGLKIVPTLIVVGMFMGGLAILALVNSTGLPSLTVELLDILIDIGLFTVFLAFGLGIGPRRD